MPKILVTHPNQNAEPLEFEGEHIEFEARENGQLFIKCIEEENMKGAIVFAVGHWATVSLFYPKA